MAKRLSIQLKKEILDLFISGNCSINDISNKFEVTSATIIRNIKKELGNEKYKQINNARNAKNNSKPFPKEVKSKTKKNEYFSCNTENTDFDFVELPPVDYEIENSTRKEISSVSIQDVEFPDVVYMIVNNNIELEIKLLGDCPDWEFLPNEDLKRKTIEIYFDLKSAKRACIKDQKVIKVPNTDVFRIVSPILISRGISRIVSKEKLIAL